MLAYACLTQYMCTLYAVLRPRILQGCFEDSLSELAELRAEEQLEMDNFLAALHADIAEMDDVMDGLEDALHVLSVRDISSDQEKH